MAVTYSDDSDGGQQDTQPSALPAVLSLISHSGFQNTPPRGLDVGFYKLLDRAAVAPTGFRGNYGARPSGSYGELKNFVHAEITDVDKMIGTALAESTETCHAAYGFGSKNSASGSIDCSGWVAEDTLKIMEQINQKAGKQIYDIGQMQKHLQQSAAGQIADVGNKEGFFLNPADVWSGKVPPGTIIGVQRKNVPGWAQGRFHNISHIAQVVYKDGQLMISQSSTGGVHLTPYEKFLSDPSIAAVYAVNPFALTKEKSNELREALKSGPKPADDEKKTGATTPSSINKSPKAASRNVHAVAPAPVA